MNAIKKEKQRREVVHGFWISERGWKETDQFLGANPYEECMEGVLGSGANGSRVVSDGDSTVTRNVV